MAIYPAKPWQVQDTPVMRANRAVHKIKSEIALLKDKAKSVEMSKDTFDKLRQLTKSPSFDLKHPNTPEGAMGLLNGVPINQNDAIDYGDALIVQD